MAAGLRAALRDKVQQELRRRDKALAAANCHLDLVAYDDPALLDEGLNCLEAIERASWKASSGTAIISDQRELAFYRDVFRIRTPRTRGRLFVLTGAPRDGPF